MQFRIDPPLAQLQAQFAETGCALLPGFLTAPLLEPLQKLLKTAMFVPKNEIHEGTIFGSTSFVPVGEPAMETLHFILNQPDLFQIVEHITGCSQLGNFTGRLHRTAACAGQAIDWHNDAVQGRTVGLNINLSTEEFSGGLFQIRGPDSEMRTEVKHSTAGGAFLFRIDCGWQHRLTEVESGQRTVAVGWFRTGPDWRAATRAWFDAGMNGGEKIQRGERI
ncbi:MAG TPA: 2OG-Fe(II) oxygenase [Bryobacteraceae bacterium]|jgi:hypothetical protein